MPETRNTAKKTTMKRKLLMEEGGSSYPVEKSRKTDVNEEGVFAMKIPVMREYSEEPMDIDDNDSQAVYNNMPACSLYNTMEAGAHNKKAVSQMECDATSEKGELLSNDADVMTYPYTDDELVDFHINGYVKITENVRVVLQNVCEYYVMDIRVYDGDGEATYKGVYIDVDQYYYFRDYIYRIAPGHILKIQTGKLIDESSEIGRGLKAKMESPYQVINVREHFINAKDLKVLPTKRGVIIPFHAVKRLKKAMALIEASYDAFKNAQPCFNKFGHNFFTCPICNWKHSEEYRIMERYNNSEKGQ